MLRNCLSLERRVNLPLFSRVSPMFLRPIPATISLANIQFLLSLGTGSSSLLSYSPLVGQATFSVEAAAPMLPGSLGWLGAYKGISHTPPLFLPRFSHFTPMVVRLRSPNGRSVAPSSLTECRLEDGT